MTDRTQVLFVFFREDLDAMAFEVPEPLQLADDPMMLCWIGDMAQPPHTSSPEENGEVIRQLVHVQVEDAKIHEIWAGNASLELGKSGYYPLLRQLHPTEMPWSELLGLST